MIYQFDLHLQMKKLKLIEIKQLAQAIQLVIEGSYPGLSDSKAQAPMCPPAYTNVNIILFVEVTLREKGGYLGITEVLDICLLGWFPLLHKLLSSGAGSYNLEPTPGSELCPCLASTLP